ncbi:MAG: ATP-binding protein [Eubacterium ventriosum]
METASYWGFPEALIPFVSLYLLKDISSEMNLTLYVVHINHHIRGKQAQHDADYVKDVCRKLNVDFKQIDADVPLMVKQTGMTEEEAGRQARYKAFFERAIEVKIKEKNKLRIRLKNQMKAEN